MAFTAGDVGRASVDLLRADARGLQAAAGRDHQPAVNGRLGRRIRNVALAVTGLLLAEAAGLNTVETLSVYAALVGIRVLPAPVSG